MSDDLVSVLLFVESIIWLVVTIFMYRDLYKGQSWKDISSRMKLYRVLTLIGLVVSVVLLVIRIFSELVGKA